MRACGGTLNAAKFAAAEFCSNMLKIWALVSSLSIDGWAAFGCIVRHFIALPACGVENEAFGPTRFLLRCCAALAIRFCMYMSCWSPRLFGAILTVDCEMQDVLAIGPCPEAADSEFLPNWIRSHLHKLYLTEVYQILRSCAFDGDKLDAPALFGFFQ